jgi:hypothetical protein
MVILARVIFRFIADVLWMSVPRRRPQAGFPYVYVNQDGSVRELSQGEQEYLSKKFDPFDGARPYIKSNYRSLDGWGSLSGYLERRRVPSIVEIQNVNPGYDMAAKDLKEDLLGIHRASGDAIVTNSNGSVTCTPNPSVSRKERMERSRKYQLEQQSRREALAKARE